MPWNSSLHIIKFNICVSQAIPGLGRGLVSNVPIPAGDLILQETASIVCTPEQIKETVITNKLSTLSQEKITIFANLQSKNLDAGTTPNREKFTNNAVSIDECQYGLFLTIAMVNHSCIPNAGMYFKHCQSEVCDCALPFRHGRRSIHCQSPVSFA